MATATIIKIKSNVLTSSKITRRDFVSGSLVGSGAALLTAKAPGLVSKAEATSINVRPVNSRKL